MRYNKPGIAIVQQQPVERAPQGFYGGAALGGSIVNISDSTFSGAGGSLTKDETDTAWKLFAGYRIHRNVAIEGGYTDFGEFSATRTFTPANSATVRFKVRGFHLEGVGIIPIRNFSILLKAGTLYSTTKTSASSTGAVTIVGNPNSKKSEFNLKLGVGGAYEISRNWGVRVEYEQVFSVGDTGGDVGMLSVGGIYKF
jgi:OOP family OmpA-OmpF porin